MTTRRRGVCATLAVFLAAAASATSADNNQGKELDSVRQQLRNFPVLSGGPDELFSDFVSTHVTPVREAYQMLLTATQGGTLTAEQAAQVLGTFRPVLQVDTLRRMVCYGLAQGADDAEQFFESRRLLLDTLARQLPAAYSAVLHRYQALLNRIYQTYVRTPQLAPRLNRAWMRELDAIRGLELAMHKRLSAPQTHRLANFSQVHGQHDRPICGAASLAMGLEFALHRPYDPADIANVIGWDGTTGPIMWAYAYQHAGMKKARLQVLSLTELKELVSRNTPVVVLQHFSQQKKFGHARLIVGYNDATGKVEYVESADGAVRTMDYSECEQLWAPLLFTALILEN